MKRVWILIFITVMLCGCGRQAGYTDEKLKTEQGADMSAYDFSEFGNVKITGCDVNSLSEAEQGVLYTQARYCQAMTDADTDAMREMVSEDMQYVHMSGRKQTREEYFADIESGALTYYTIGINHPVIEVNGDTASITYTSVLNANAYGARGTFRMSGTHHYRNVNGKWILVNR